ncbi:hypothetical protein [Marinimicrobium agarilyticum]|nr:hypothetical protein [Marinimicrobium agarilyticum]
MASDTEQTGIHHGTFFGWFETGLEELVWALKPTDDDSLEGLVILEK